MRIWKAISFALALVSVSVVSVACSRVAGLPRSSALLGKAISPQNARLSMTFHNDTKDFVSWHRRASNCMSLPQHHEKDVPGGGVRHLDWTAKSSGSCNFNIPWYVLRFTTRNGDYRDFAIDYYRGSARDWRIENRAHKGNLRFCLSRTNFVRLIRGDTC